MDLTLENTLPAIKIGEREREREREKKRFMDLFCDIAKIKKS